MVVFASRRMRQWIRVVIDIEFGDAVEPGLAEMDLPVMLDFPAPHLRAYARETVIAEKFQAMVMLGRANSRMKDFYDIWVLSRASEFNDDRLARAIAATFARRNTEIPSELPDAQTPSLLRARRRYNNGMLLRHSCKERTVTPSPTLICLR
jgi:predicted nucleotidyltransferase component of viral defense system